MARYRKIDVRVWDDERFRRLSAPPPNGQTLWFHLLTGPHTSNIPGLSRAGEQGLAETLGWSLKGFREAFREVSREGLAKANWEARVVWVPKGWRYNPPASPNVVRNWRMAWDEIPNCVLKHEAWGVLKDFTEAFGEAFGKAFLKACPKPSPNQDQDQEQEQENPLSLGSPPPPRPRRPVKVLPLLPWPEDFAMTDAHRAYAARNGLDPAFEWGAFRDHHRAKGSRFADWTAAWQTWCRKSFTFAAERAARR